MYIYIYISIDIYIDIYIYIHIYLYSNFFELEPTFIFAFLFSSTSMFTFISHLYISRRGERLSNLQAPELARILEQPPLQYF